MEKDLSTKELLRNPEVFADVVNVHLFDGHRVIAPGELLDALYALSKDKRYLEVRSKMQEKEEEITRKGSQRKRRSLHKDDFGRWDREPAGKAVYNNAGWRDRISRRRWHSNSQ